MLKTLLKKWRFINTNHITAIVINNEKNLSTILSEVINMK